MHVTMLMTSVRMMVGVMMSVRMGHTGWAKVFQARRKSRTEPDTGFTVYFQFLH